MAERPKYQVAFQFKNVQLFKDQSLGIGSYGAVYKSKCDDLLCAAKMIHPTLFAPTVLHQVAPQRVHRLPIRRFEQECEFMSAIRHPNIVQYLGMFRDTDTCLPALLMELMDDSLTHFLESSMQPIPYHIQVNICHDITLALSFLHSNNIVHRGLSSNNVLLRGNVLAKVTDFGMARLGDINPRFTSTMCPGTDVYMPPEAVQDKPVYTEKIDCFSFGVITVQILTRQFPKPGDRLQEVELNHQGLPKRKLLMQMSEVDRRQTHISQVDQNHSLLPIALNCLKDKDNERPSAHQLCERVADLKGMSEYIVSAQDKDEVIRSLTIHVEEDKLAKENHKEIQQLRQRLHQANRQLEERERQLNQQLTQLQQESDQALRENRIQLQERERQFACVNQQLEASERVVAQFERRIAELEQQLQQQKTKATSRGKELISIRWREGERAPHKMSRWCDAVVDGNTVYVRNGNTVKIYSYDATTHSWSQQSDCVHDSSSMTIINGSLTTVGRSCSNELFSLNDERRWTLKKFPPMPTKRKHTTAVCTGTLLIVAGGVGEGERILSTVEVMITENHQWSAAADLPEPIYTASATVCGNQLYLLGGLNKDSKYTKSVYTCSVSALLKSCDRSSLKTKPQRTFRASVWRQVADLPVVCSSCESFHGQLVAIGGMMDSGEATTAVYMYNSTTNFWKIISHMTTGRYDCFTAVLPNDQLMVVGGWTDGVITDTVEVASVYN